nr:immunoglobulin light chain junction region [Macaca mulatta]
CLQSGDWPHSF